MIQTANGRTLEELRESAAMWQFFRDLFDFPSLKQWIRLQDERSRAAWEIVRRNLKAGVPPEIPVPTDVQAYEETYLATFEVGIPHPVCPLIESHWNKRFPVPAILHENILFYKQFGLELRPGAGEMADHLRYQLEFLHHLDCLEIRAWRDESGGETIRQIHQARRDFLERHPGYWIPAAARVLKEKRDNTWPSHWISLLALALERAMEDSSLPALS
ncbi:MAG: hypothetical protein HPY51_14125 [Candidatus Omnitrophica bacterium]|nr:hypothetical protein [Candidatus Omnitrophota bacterium]